MYLLIGAILVFALGRLSITPPFNGVDPVVSFLLLILCHVLLGVMAWHSHYHDFANRILSVIALAMIGYSYILNWPAYAVPTRTAEEPITVATIDATYTSVLLDFMVILGVLIPVFMSFGGFIVAIITAPRMDEVEE